MEELRLVAGAIMAGLGAVGGAIEAAQLPLSTWKE